MQIDEQFFKILVDIIGTNQQKIGLGFGLSVVYLKSNRSYPIEKVFYDKQWRTVLSSLFL